MKITRTSQPQTPVGIDWANPNTKNLYFACDRFGRNYAGRIANLGTSGTLTDVATAKGVGRGGGGAGYFAGATERHLVAPTNTAFSVVGTFRLGATGQTSKYLAYDYRSLSAQAAIIFGYVANTIEFYCDSFTGTSPRTGSGMVVNDTHPHTFGYSYDGTNWIGYLDGVKVFSTTRTFSLNVPTGAFTTSLLSAGGSNTLNGSILQWATFDAGIGEERLKSLTSNPYQIFSKIERPVFVGEVGAGGSPYTLTADTANIAITGADATLTYARTLTAEAAAIAISGAAATLAYNRVLAADTANLPIAGSPATLTFTPVGGYTMVAEAGTVAITGDAATLTRGYTLTANAGAVGVSASDAALIAVRKLVADSYAAVIAGADATLTYTPIVYPTIGRPASDTSNTGWTASTGTDLFAMLDEVTPDSGDYISASSVGALCKLALEQTAYPGTASQVLKYRASSSTGNSVIVRLKNAGGSLIRESTQALTSVDTEYQISLTSGEIDLIASGSLSVELESA